MMNLQPALLLSALLCLVCLSCHKPDDPSPGGPAGTCLVPRVLSGVVSNGDTARVHFDAAGAPDGMTWYNNGQLGLYVNAGSNLRFDSAGRVLFYSWPFNTTGIQTAQYFYDNSNRVFRTVTHTGNGVDYLQELTYDHGDVVAMVYKIGFNARSSSDFYYSFYDTLAPSPYFSIQSWAQLGCTRNAHLMKSEWHGTDTTYYSYRIDSNQRVMAMFRNFDNTGWVEERGYDTTYFLYSCQ